MSTTLAALLFLIGDRAPWRANWLWGLPLIVVTVLFHVLGLGFLSRKAVQIHRNGKEPRRVTGQSALMMGHSRGLPERSSESLEAGRYRPVVRKPAD